MSPFTLTEVMRCAWSQYNILIVDQCLHTAEMELLSIASYYIFSDDAHA